MPLLLKCSHRNRSLKLVSRPHPAPLPPYPPICSHHVSRALHHHHASRVRSESSRTDLSPPAGSVFRPPPPDSAMGDAQKEHEAHLAHASQVFGTRPTSVQVGGHLNSKISFWWANDDSGERIMITEAHAALTALMASLLLGQGEVSWVQLSSLLEAMHDTTPFSGGPDDFKILWRTKPQRMTRSLSSLRNTTCECTTPSGIEPGRLKPPFEKPKKAQWALLTSTPSSSLGQQSCCKTLTTPRSETLISKASSSR